MNEPSTKDEWSTDETGSSACETELLLVAPPLENLPKSLRNIAIVFIPFLMDMAGKKRERCYCHLIIISFCYNIIIAHSPNPQSGLTKKVKQDAFLNSSEERQANQTEMNSNFHQILS